MKMGVNQALVAAVIGFSGLVVPGVVHAGNEATPRLAALQKACIEGGGRFELSWAYDDQGVQWGRVVSCSTELGHITCQDNICRGDRGVLPDDSQDRGDSAMRFPAEPMAFSAALSELSRE